MPKLVYVSTFLGRLDFILKYFYLSQGHGLGSSEHIRKQTLPFTRASIFESLCEALFFSKKTLLRSEILLIFSKLFHYGTLKVVYGIDDSYNNLLLSSNSVSIHQRHLRFLVTEIFKSISQINPEFMWSAL